MVEDDEDNMSLWRSNRDCGGMMVITVMAHCIGKAEAGWGLIIGT